MTTLDLPTCDPAADAAPLVRRLVSDHGAAWVGVDSLDPFLARPGTQVLFFHGDPVRFPEVLDVAVVLPELRRAHAAAGGFGIGVATRADEDALAARLGVQRWPSLVFLRDGAWLGTIAGMLDWTDYVVRVGQTLAATPGRLPGIGIPVVAAAAGGGCR